MPEPQRPSVFKMPDGKLYRFPADVTDEELLQFAEENFPYMKAEPSHGGGRMTTLPGEWAGLATPGNLDLSQRPSVPNPEGGTSSVLSMSIGVDGKEYLIPRVSRGGELLDEKGAIAEFERTGQHLGAFDSPENATKYAEALHRQQAALESPSAVGEESGSRQGPPLAPSHARSMTQKQVLDRVERQLASPSTAAGTLYASGRGLGTDMDRAISGVAPAPPSYAEGFFSDPLPYLGDIAKIPLEEAKKLYQDPASYMKDAFQVLQAPGEALERLAVPERYDLSEGRGEPALARALERGFTDVGSMVPAAAGAVTEVFRRGTMTALQQPLPEQSEFAREMARVSVQQRESAQDVKLTGPENIFQTSKPSQASEYIVNVFGSQAPIIGGLVTATVLGGPAALIPAAAALETGSIAQEQAMKKGRIEPEAAVIGGTVAGALEALPIFAWMRRTGWGDDAMRWVVSRASSAIAQAPEEATTEYAQTLIEALAVEWLAENMNRITQADWQGALEVIKETQPEAVAAAATGGVAGVMFGAMGGKAPSEAEWRAKQKQLFRKMLREKTKAEKVAQEGRGEATFEAVTKAGEGRFPPPLGSSPEVTGGPTVPPFVPAEPTYPPPEPPQEPPAAPPAAPEPPQAPPGGGITPAPAGALPGAATVRRKGEPAEPPGAERRTGQDAATVPPEVSAGGPAAIQRWLEAPEVLRRFPLERTQFALGNYRMVRNFLEDEQLHPWNRPTFTAEQWEALEGEMKTVHDRAVKAAGESDIETELEEAPLGAPPAAAPAARAPEEILEETFTELAGRGQPPTRVEMELLKRDIDAAKTRLDALRIFETFALGDIDITDLAHVELMGMKQAADDYLEAIGFEPKGEGAAAPARPRRPFPTGRKIRQRGPRAEPAPAAPEPAPAGPPSPEQRIAQLEQKLRDLDLSIMKAVSDRRREATTPYHPPPTAEQIARFRAEEIEKRAGQRRSIERKIERLKRRVKPAAPEPAAPEPTDERTENQRFEEFDAAERQLERMGATTVVNTSGQPVSYKLIGDTADGPWSYERVTQGQRETIVGTRGERFGSLEEARLAATQDMKERMGAAAPQQTPPDRGVVRDVTKMNDNEIFNRIRDLEQIVEDAGAYDVPVDPATEQELAALEAEWEKRHPPAPPDEEQLSLDEILDPDWTFRRMFGEITTMLGTRQLTDAEVDQLQGFFDPDNTRSWQGEPSEEEFSKYLELVRQVDKLWRERGLDEEQAAAPEPEEPPARPEPEERIVDEGTFQKIKQSYSADKIGERNTARKAVVVDGKKYIATAGYTRGGLGMPSYEAYEQVTREEFIEEFGEEPRKYGEVPPEKLRDQGLGFWHGQLIKRGKSLYALKGPPITFTISGGTGAKAPAAKPTRATTIKDMKDDWTVEEFLEGIPRILDTLGDDITLEELEHINAHPIWFTEKEHSEAENQAFDTIIERMDEIQARLQKQAPRAPRGPIPGTPEYFQAHLTEDVERIKEFVDEEPQSLQQIADRYVKKHGKELDDDDRAVLLPRMMRAAERLHTQGGADFVTEEQGGVRVTLVKKPAADATQQEVYDAVIAVVTSSPRAIPFRDIVAGVQSMRGLTGSARIEEALSQAARDGKLEKVDKEWRATTPAPVEEPVAPKKAPKAEKGKGDIATPVVEIADSKGYYRSDGPVRASGFTDSQMRWIAERIETSWGEIPEEIKETVPRPAMRIKVPDDGTFTFYDRNGVGRLYKTVKGTKRLPGLTQEGPFTTSSSSLRVKPIKSSMAVKPLGYNMNEAWLITIPTEDGTVYSTPHVLIMRKALLDSAGKKLRDRITAKPTDKQLEEASVRYRQGSPVPKKATEDLIRRAKELARHEIRVKTLAWPNRIALKEEFRLILETEKGTEITDMGLNYNIYQALLEATGFDTMKTDMALPDAQRIISLWRDGEFVGILMPQKTDTPADAPNPAREEHEAEEAGEPPPNTSTKASYGRYRDFHANNGSNGPMGGALAQPAPPTLRVLGIGMPELVKLAKLLGRGRYPRVKRVLLRNAGVLGYFRPSKVVGKEYIALKAGIFVEPEQAAATLAHEIGHWVDYIPDRLFTRGNLLGRLMSVVKYLKHTASMLPSQPGFISEADRKRLRAQAKKENREEYWEEIEETIKKEFGVTVEDVLNIWRQYEPQVPKDLLDYIKGLSGPQKVAIVKQAMNGLLAPELQKFKTIIEEKTGKKIRVKKVRYVDVEKKFRELLFAEMKKRQLVSLEEIHDEMWALSLHWRPLGGDVSEAFLRYRKRGEEIYADAVSAFLNDPATFQRIAPKSFQMFLNYLHRKGEFYDTWMMLQQVADNPEELNRQRASDYEEMIARGERARAESLKERLGIGQGFREHRVTIGHALASGLIDSNAAWYRLRRITYKRNQKLWQEDRDPINFIEELAYSNAKYAYYLDRWQAEVYGPLKDIVNSVELGVILGLRRAGRARKRGGRKELANPLGIGDEYARGVLAQYLKDKGLTREKKETLVEALQRWQEIREEVIAEIEASGMFSKDLIKVMRDSVGSYATYKVRQYIEDADPRVSDAMGNIQRQIGTLNEIGNPVIETILKDMALARAAHRTQAIKAMVSQLKAADPSAVQDVRQTKFRGVATGFPAAPRGYTLMTYLQRGQVRGHYIRDDYAKALKHREAGAAYQFYRMGTGLVRALMVTHNPFWAIWNTERDFRAMVKQVTPGNPVTSILRAAYWTLTSTPEAFKDVARSTKTLEVLGAAYTRLTGKKFDPEARVVREMMRNRALIQTGMRFYTASDVLEDEATAMLLETYGLTESAHHNMVRKVFGHLAAALSAPGQFSERLIKISGYRMLKAHQKELGLSDQDIAHLTRSRVGTPDIMRRGDWHNFTNSMFLFSNVAKEGYRSAWETWENDPIGYTSKLITYDILPTVIKWAAASGLMGAAIKGLFDRIPEYQKRTYTIIPIALTTSGKAVYITLPHDHIGQLVASASWALLNQNEPIRQNVAWEMAQNMPWSHGSLHPYVESTLQWAQYASGVNPSDWYRGRPVVPERVWETGDRTMRRKYMLGNTFDNVGLRILTDISGLEDENGDVTPEKVADWIEKGSSWPVAGTFLRRFIRVTDRGLIEEGFRRFRLADEPGNKASYQRDEVLKEVLKVDPNATGRDALYELERRGVDPAYTWDKRKELLKKLDTRMDTLRMREHGTPWDFLRSYANDEDRRRALEEWEREVEEGQ
jgi:hypothetical protein